MGRNHVAMSCQTTLKPEELPSAYRMDTVLRYIQLYRAQTSRLRVSSRRRFLSYEKGQDSSEAARVIRAAQSRYKAGLAFTAHH